MNKVALVIIHNHQHNMNIDVLENIYSNRFTTIYHLVPFYSGEKTNVIPVYENSYYFQGYIAQGFKSFFNGNYAHYFFIADDLLLNPIINEKNYTEHFKLKQHTCFLPGFITLHEQNERWPRINEAFRYTGDVPGVEVKNQLPGYDSALQAFKNFGLEIKPLSFNQIGETPASIKEWARIIMRDRFYTIRYIKNKFIKKQYDLSYPLIGSYSDICVVSSDAVKQFCRYCGIFAATKLHVELALPTALVLAAQDIITEEELKLHGKALWPDGYNRLNGDLKPAKGDYEELESFNYSLKQLLGNFPENYLYLHPIKLSQWNTYYEKIHSNNVNH